MKKKHLVTKKKSSSKKKIYHYFISYSVHNTFSVLTGFGNREITTQRKIKDFSDLEYFSTEIENQLRESGREALSGAKISILYWREWK
jgi:hypothetical protein